MDNDHSAELERLGVTYEVLLDFVRKQRIGTEVNNSPNFKGGLLRLFYSRSSSLLQ